VVYTEDSFQIGVVVSFAARTLLAMLLLGLAAFCIVGFMATYEPGSRNVWAWRIGYGAAGAASLLAAGYLAYGGGKKLAASRGKNRLATLPTRERDS
jgi:hypothetical protein